SKNLFLRATKICALLAFAGTTVLVLHGRDILRFWIGEGFTSNYNVLLVLTMGYCVILMQSASNVFLYVRSRHKAFAALSYRFVLDGDERDSLRQRGQLIMQRVKAQNA